jgi:hypothetical protein
VVIVILIKKVIMMKMKERRSHEISFSHAASMKMKPFWDTAPCNLVEVDQRSRGFLWV